MKLFMLLLDGAAVTVFGSVLASAFCDGLNSRKNRWIIGAFVLIDLAVQGCICYIWSTDVLQFVYPLVTHFPLILLLCALTKKKLWPVCSVLIAYLCCQLRRWLALLLVELLGGSYTMQAAVQLIVTVPLFLSIMRFAVPAVRKMTSYPGKLQVQFGAIPAFYYVFDYLTVIYTDLLVSGKPVIVEFMPFVCCGAYLVFLLYHAEQEWRKLQLQQAKNILDVQINQSVREIDALRESQSVARQYRHDLRHHLQYIFTCIENGQDEQAKAYITDVCREIEAQMVVRYCDNISVNLILSALAGRAKEKGITMKIQANIAGTKSRLTESDLCVLLSNALENAIHACCELETVDKKQEIDVTIYEKSDKFFLEVINPCRDGIRFKNDVPISEQPGHGVGVQSICAVAQRYQGVYFFGVQDGKFVLRVSI